MNKECCPQEPEKSGQKMEMKPVEEKKESKKIFQDPKTGQVLTPKEWEERKNFDPNAWK